MLSRGRAVDYGDWRMVMCHKLVDCRSFKINRGTMVVSDDSVGVCGMVDAIVSHGDSKAIVKFFGPDDPDEHDELDMVVCMYLTGLWDGFSIRVDRDGIISESYMVGPSRKEAVEMLDGVFPFSRGMVKESLSGVTPPAVPGQHCLCCRFREGCIQQETGEADRE
jgi:hypothetical protein